MLDIKPNTVVCVIKLLLANKIVNLHAWIVPVHIVKSEKILIYHTLNTITYVSGLFWIVEDRTVKNTYFHICPL